MNPDEYMFKLTDYEDEDKPLNYISVSAENDQKDKYLKKLIKIILSDQSLFECKLLSMPQCFYILLHRQIKNQSYFFFSSFSSKYNLRKMTIDRSP